MKVKIEVEMDTDNERDIQFIEDLITFVKELREEYGDDNEE